MPRLEPTNKEYDLSKIKERGNVKSPSTLEGCLVRMIDKIAYFGRDLEDAIRSNIIKEENFKQKAPPSIRNLLVENNFFKNGRLVRLLLEDLIINSFGKNCIALSEEKYQILRDLIDYNNHYIYRSDAAQLYKDRARKVLELLFQELWNMLRSENCFQHDKEKYEGDFLKNPNIPFVLKTFYKFVRSDMKGKYKIGSDPPSLLVLDFVAGMTDNFTVRSFRELFVPVATV